MNCCGSGVGKYSSGEEPRLAWKAAETKQKPEPQSSLTSYLIAIPSLDNALSALNMITLLLYVLFFASLCSRNHAWTAKSIVRKFLLLVAYSATVDIMTAKPGSVHLPEWAETGSLSRKTSSAIEEMHFTGRFSEDFNSQQNTSIEQAKSLVTSNCTPKVQRWSRIARHRCAESIGDILPQKYLSLFQGKQPKQVLERHCVLLYCIPPSTIGA